MACRAAADKTAAAAVVAVAMFQENIVLAVALVAVALR